MSENWNSNFSSHARAANIFIGFIVTIDSQVPSNQFLEAKGSESNDSLLISS